MSLQAYDYKDLWKLETKPVFLERIEYCHLSLLQSFYDDKECYNYITAGIVGSWQLKILWENKLVTILGYKRSPGADPEHERDSDWIYIVQVSFRGMWLIWNVEKLMKELNKDCLRYVWEQIDQIKDSFIPELDDGLEEGQANASV